MEPTLFRKINPNMLVIAMTGGIGSGKSTVAHIFEHLGVPIIDSDQIAHKLVQKGTQALKTIVEHFGTWILDIHQELNRSQLRAYIFQNPQEKNWLETLLHPLIIEEIQNQIAMLNATYCIVVIPLLFETTPIHTHPKSIYPFIDRILLVDAPPSLQLKRAQKRDQTCEAEINIIMNSQVSQAQRVLQADDQLLNDADLVSLEQQVHQLHTYYLELSKKSTA